MNHLVNGFLDGFTGAGMFLGPRPREVVSLLADESAVAEEQWIDSVRELLQMVASRANDRQRSEVVEEVRKIAGRIVPTSQTAVESGSHR